MAQAQQQGSGLEAHGITNVARVLLEPERSGAVRGGGPPARGRSLPRTARSSAAPGSTPAARRTTSSSSRSRRARTSVWWSKVNRPIDAAAFRRAAPADAELRRRARAVRAGLLCRRRSALPPAGPHHHRAGLAQPVRPAHVHRRAGRGRRAGAHAGVHRHRHAGLHADPAAPRHELRSLHPPELREEARADRRHELRRRDQEVDLHGHELPAAAAQRAVDALLGQRRPGGRRRALLRPVGHRQDDALERSGARPDRRRRARLERGRRLQLRRRLLREDDPALGGGRAADLRDHAPVRHGARERQDGRDHARSSISTTTR